MCGRRILTLLLESAIRVSPDVVDRDDSFAAESVRLRGSAVRRELRQRRAAKRARTMGDDDDDEIIITDVRAAPRIKTEPSNTSRTITQARDLRVTFVDEHNYIRRERSWRHCNSSEKMFAHALAAGLLASSNDVSVLKATVGVAELLLVKGDRTDFEELVEVVKQGRVVKGEDDAVEDCAGDDRAVVVEVRRL